ncbi:MAG: hypothetical protein IJS50_03165, partial [Desulfovibrio sp.]|nr:hypothetical protein [Desulfovibrio sp.]
MQSTALGSQDFAKDVLSIDGVYYALLENGGASFRLGSRASNWREALPPLGVNPTEEGLKALEQQGIFLGRASTTKPLALMCQGMGALWPGVGRELYEEFPVAREAMDRLASYASWDVLHLLEEA